MRYLTFAQITRLNQRTVERHGGNFIPPHNLLHAESLHYLLDAVSAEMYEAPLYPTVADKAAVYMHNIISNHVFQDGNKRTGIGAALAFLQMNNYKLKFPEREEPLPGEPVFPTSAEQAIYNFTLAVASAQRDLPAVRAWFAARPRPVS